MTSTRRHGTEYCYNNKCRCTACRRAHAARQAQSVAERRKMLEADPTLRPHGNASTYKNWGCRCEPCVKEGSAQRTAAQRVRSSKPKPPINNIFSARRRGRNYREIQPFGRDWLDDDSVRT